MSALDGRAWMAAVATGDEVTMLAAYARKHGMANVCRLILNSNEFVFVN